MNKMTAAKTGEIVIYQAKDGKASLEVKLQDETVWLSLDQLSALFDRDNSVVSRHIHNVFRDGELSREAVVANFATTAADGKTYQMDFYNLDVIISVGYRVKSLRGTQFRIWATSVLRDHLLKGFTIRPKRLDETGLAEFEQAVGLIKQVVHAKQLSSGETTGLLEVITTYANTWVLLQKYDEERLDEVAGTKMRRKLDYPYALRAVDQLKQELVRKQEAGELFGQERNHQFEAVMGTLYQTFGGDELYATLEEKAAHLLYFIIKDHPFVDGNKRIASFLFIVLLAQNRKLYRRDGEKRINDNALVALALLIAESKPSQKDVLVKVVMNMLSGK